MNNMAIDPAAVITGRLAYFDTVSIWIPRLFLQFEKDVLASLCGSLIQRPAWRTSKTGRWMLRRGFKARLTLNQPTNDALRYLKKCLGSDKPVLINCVDCALDLYTDSCLDARDLQNYLDARLYKPYHRAAHQVVNYKEETTYVGFKNKGMQVITYSDKLSRHNGSPCCHLEFHHQSNRVVAKLGVRTLADLLAFDHSRFWKKRLRLVGYSHEELGKKWAGKSLREQPRIIKSKWVHRNMDEWAGLIICRSLANKFDTREPVLMDVIAKFSGRGLRISRLLKEVDNSALLMGLLSQPPEDERS